MAVEAQLCPQCGAAVQFGDGQTQVVCSHCGTTVARLAAASAPSVEKEIADEKLIQKTVGLEKKLRGHGRPATAKIVSAQATDIFRATVEGKAVLMSLAVEVQPEGEPAFAAETQVLVGLVAIDKYRAGTVLDVRFDPQDHTQVSVEGRHGAPNSNPEEQARKRQAKEQARRQRQQAQGTQDAAPAAEVGSPAWWQAQQGQGGGAEPARAWGGPRPAGGVPVPVEFDGVSSLGPASAVHLSTGGLQLPHFGPPRPNALVIYHDGLAFRAGKVVHTWRWEELGAIQSNVWYSGDKVIFTEHSYTLIKSSAEQVILDDGLKDVVLAVIPIKRAVFARLWPPLAQAYGAGQAITFGPVTIQKANGIQVDGKPLAWSTILEIKTERGRLSVTLRDSKKHEARVSAIPNVELAARLLGLDYSENAYY